MAKVKLFDSTELLTSQEMRNCESSVIESGRVTGLELMERAGQGVVESVFEAWPDLRAGDPLAHAPDSTFPAGRNTRRAAVLCGPGNNGGDGFVIARLLAARGWEVVVFLYGDPDKLPPDARVNHDRWSGDVRRWPCEDGFDPQSVDLIVDALFGTGLTRGLTFDDGLGNLLPERNSRGAPNRPRVVAVDVPSGLCSDSGRRLEGDALWADLTVTFHTAKPGHYLAEGPCSCGSVVVVDIGLRPGVSHQEWCAETLTGSGPATSTTFVAGPGGGPNKHDPLGRSSHKYSFGHAVILSGSMGRTGAARLAARATLRVGAGLVTLGVPGSAQMEVAAQITALMMARVDDGAQLEALLEDSRLNALCLGPGLGLERARALVPVALGSGGVKPRPVVLDADALSAFAEAPEDLFALLHDTCILTPHGGEFARLFPDLAARLSEAPVKGPAYSKLDATREAAARAGCTVLFKGPDTVIAGPGGDCAIHSAAYDRAAPWLATAGTGDVLAGLITGLLAFGYAPMDAAASAAWLHVESARTFGPGLIAEDLPDMLPRVFRDLGL